MKQIEINIANWKRVEDKVVLNFVSKCMGEIAKYGREQNGTNREYFSDSKSGIELQIMYK